MNLGACILDAFGQKPGFYFNVVSSQPLILTLNRVLVNPGLLLTSDINPVTISREMRNI